MMAQDDNSGVVAIGWERAEKDMTVSVALNSLEGQEVLDWGVMMTASAIVVIPAVVFFMLIQKKIAGGLTEGSVK